jgi:phosphomannomutase
MDAIEFGTDGWRATLDEFTDERLRAVAQAVATHLAEEGVEGPVGVGYDARETSRGFAEEVARVLCANGRDAVLPERDCPTPLLAWAIVDRDLAGGVMITASHNPPEYNGVKFIPRDGAPALPGVTEAIEANLGDVEALPERQGLLGAALDYRTIAETIARWIHSEYTSEHTNQDYRTALRSFGRYRLQTRRDDRQSRLDSDHDEQRFRSRPVGA